MTQTHIGADVDLAVTILRDGGVIGIPTETVYGLGADATNLDAVQRVFRIKGRPVDHPLIVHVADIATARTWSSDWTPEAETLAAAFWPGPLTIVVARAGHVFDAITGGHPTVAVRCPSHPLMLRLLSKLDRGIAAPSANRFGKVSPTTAQHVVDDLGGDVDYVLDGGPCTVGLESTIVDCTVDPPQVLRPGAITEQKIADVLGAVAPANGPSRAPGMMQSHYAPSCTVHPVASLDEATASVEHLTSRGVDATKIRVLDASVDPESFASTMYSDLRDCDTHGVHDVFVVLPPDIGIGQAIRDRILKAAAGR